MGLLQEIIPFIIAYWPLVLFSAVTAYLLSNKYNKGLNKYPGHWLAAYTDWWRFFDALGRKTEYTHINLHRKYGDIVRLGPNVLSFADPRAIKIIYGLNKGMTKVHIHSSTTSPLAKHSQVPLHSPISTPSNKPSPTASVYHPSSLPQMKITTPSTDDA